MPKNKKSRQLESVHLLEFHDVPKEWLDKAIESEFDALLRLRPHVMKALEDKRGAGMIGSSLEAKLVFRTASERDYKYLAGFGEELADMFVVSQALVEKVKDVAAPLSSEFAKTEVHVMKAEGAKCARSWKYSLDVGADPEFPNLSLKSAKIVKEIWHAKDKSS